MCVCFSTTFDNHWKIEKEKKRRKKKIPMNEFYFKLKEKRKSKKFRINHFRKCNTHTHTHILANKKYFALPYVWTAKCCCLIVDGDDKQTI